MSLDFNSIDETIRLSAFYLSSITLTLSIPIGVLQLIYPDRMRRSNIAEVERSLSKHQKPNRNTLDIIRGPDSEIRLGGAVYVLILAGFIVIEFDTAFYSMLILAIIQLISFNATLLFATIFPDKFFKKYKVDKIENEQKQQEIIEVIKSK